MYLTFINPITFIANFCAHVADNKNRAVWVLKVRLPLYGVTSDVAGAGANSMLQGLKPLAHASRHLWRPVFMVISQGV